MRIARLADILNFKYDLVAEGIIRKVMPLNQIKNDLVNTYNLYVNSNTAKEPVFQMLANIKEPFSKNLIFNMEKIISSIDDISPNDLLLAVNGILGLIKNVKNDPKNTVRNFIHDSIRVTKQSEKNYREHVKSKFETILAKVSYSLQQIALNLQHFTQVQGPLEGGAIEPQRKDISKEKLLMFMRTPAAQHYGLDHIDVMTKLLSYQDTKDKIITLINAIDRGHIPADGSEVMAEASVIKKILADKENTNLPALENMSEKPTEEDSLLDKEL